MPDTPIPDRTADHMARQVNAAIGLATPAAIGEHIDRDRPLDRAREHRDLYEAIAASEPFEHPATGETVRVADPDLARDARLVVAYLDGLDGNGGEKK